MTDVFWRQMDILNPDEMKPVTLIGCGAIGSATGLMLAKLGIKDFTLFDPDEIEEHNIPNQLYPSRSIGLFKIDELNEVMNNFAPQEINVKAVQKKFDGNDINPIVICAVDSMKERKEIWKKIKYQAQASLYIDARMGGETMRIYAINPCDPDHIEFYEKTFYSADDLPCTAQSIIYNIFVISGLIGSLIKKHLKGQPCVKEMIFKLDDYNLYFK